MEIAILAAALVVAAAFIAIALYLRRGTAAEEAGSVHRLNEQISQLAGAQAELVGRLGQLTEAQARSQTELQKTVNDRLDQLGTRMNTSLNEQTTKTGETLTKLQERLAVIDAAQKNISELSGKVVGLQDILSNKQARGAFGEIQLESLVRDALPPSSFEFQATLSNGKRADCIIRMPKGQGVLVIDAKFPLEGYRGLQAARTAEEVTAAQRLFIQSTRKHIQDIAARYIVDGETTGSAMMFLPSEAVYGELHANFEALVQESLNARVYIVSPNTMMATLQTIRAVMRDVEMQEQAHLIQAEVGKMADDVDRLDKRVENLARHFEQAEKDVRDIKISSDKVKRSASRITEVQLEEPDSPKALPHGE